MATQKEARSLWREPLIQVLEGYPELLRETSSFPRLGKLPPLVTPEDLETLKVNPAAAPAAVVVVVVVVAVAARPGALTSEEVLKAKLLDVYDPREREILREAVAQVRNNPALIKFALGIDPKTLGREFPKRLAQVEKAVS